ncbi:hypothetical protein O181_034261 [Austropuccinia psidii MF-1]|uniref:Uncharacterized protein n=1 Tax=Austropuccinia psidii MF-1 TaxID=1389203 RepID=A0A9Q3H7V0_9BASI|nr:hypothetical protein [Austropuccinia psidii MF-1]
MLAVTRNLCVMMKIDFQRLEDNETLQASFQVVGGIPRINESSQIPMLSLAVQSYRRSWQHRACNIFSPTLAVFYLYRYNVKCGDAYRTHEFPPEQGQSMVSCTDFNKTPYKCLKDTCDKFAIQTDNIAFKDCHKGSLNGSIQNIIYPQAYEADNRCAKIKVLTGTYSNGTSLRNVYYCDVNSPMRKNNRRIRCGVCESTSYDTTRFDAKCK